MSTFCGDYYTYRDGKCQTRQTNSVFYFVTSIVALLVLASVVFFCVCCVCIRRRRLWLALHNRGGPGLAPASGLNAGNLAYMGPVSGANYHSEMEEGTLRSGNPPGKTPGVAVIMPGEAEVTFIAEPSSPIRASPKEKTNLGSIVDESSGSYLTPQSKHIP